MSGAEPFLVSALVGAGVGAAGAGLSGRDPLTGALLGGTLGAATGGLGSGAAAGGTGAASAGTAGGASLIESGTTGLAGAAMEQGALLPAMYSEAAFLQAAGLPVPPTELAARELGFNTAEQAIGAGMMDASGATTALGVDRLSQLGAPLASKAGSMGSLEKYGSMASKLTQGNQPQQMSAPSMKAPKTPSLLDPISQLLEQQQMPRRQRGRISLL